MSKLFEAGIAPEIPKKILADVLLKARREIGKGEDDWDTQDTCKVIGMLPLEYQEEFRGADAIRLKNIMQRLRKDKIVPKVKPPKTEIDRFLKMFRDFERNRQRRGDSHLSDFYRAYVVDQSDEWRKKALEHKKRCNWICQLCGQKTSNLEVHHTTEGYRNLGDEQPWHLLALCSTPCHPIADMFREGWFHKEMNTGFFCEEDFE